MSVPSNSDMIRVFGRIGFLSFGGPAAQIALMHRELVEERDWLDEDRFLRALSFCMLLPGPEAMQLATYAGWRLRGTLGGLIAGGLFVLPGAAIIAALVLAYAALGPLPWVQALFLGVKCAVIAIVIQALVRLAKKALKGAAAYCIAFGAFVAIFAFNVPFPLIIAIAALAGAALLQNSGKTTPAPSTTPVVPWRIGLFWTVLWLMPLAILWAFEAEFLFDLGLFFAKLAVVTFGGAYAVLAYMAQAVVETHGWITAAEMLDALGLAETTPGPLILVTQFTGMLAGHHLGGIALALAAGVLTLWMTFLPCFLWIFAAAPFLDHLTSRPKLQSALSGVTAAVTGVILNLSLWFALQVWFANVSKSSFGPISVLTPDLTSVIWPAVGLTALAVILLFGVRVGMAKTLGLMAIAGLALSLTLG